MAVLTDGRERALECDECPETTTPMDKNDFEVMVASVKSDGWEIRFNGTEYTHKCPGCRSSDRLAAAQRLFS